MTAKYKIGAKVAGQGIYLGEWSPKDRTGKSLGKIFNLFAAPKDISKKDGTSRLMNFNEAAEYVSALHDGAGFKNDAELYAALKNNCYNGGWFIPTQDILTDRLYNNRKQKSLNKSLSIKWSGIDSAHWYWSCTEPAYFRDCAFMVNFNNGHHNWNLKTSLRISVRLVRAVELTAQEIEKKYKNAIALSKPLKLRPPIKFKRHD